MFYIYVVQNALNNKVYVGKTNKPQTRWNHHIIYAYGGKEKYPTHFQYIHASIAKYGKENFTFQIIEEFADEPECLEAEQFWIQFFRSWDKNYGYNLTNGGEGASGRIVSPETRDKIRIRATGRKQSEETKKKKSEAGRKRRNSQSTREKISKSNKGRKLTDKQRIANSTRQLGKVLPPWQIENMKKSAKRGEKSSKAKLTNEQAKEMRALFETSNYSIKKLAEMYKVSASTARDIIRHKTYKE